MATVLDVAQSAGRLESALNAKVRNAAFGNERFSLFEPLRLEVANATAAFVERPANGDNSDSYDAVIASCDNATTLVTNGQPQPGQDRKPLISAVHEAVDCLQGVTGPGTASAGPLSFLRGSLRIRAPRVILTAPPVARVAGALPASVAAAPATPTATATVVPGDSYLTKLTKLFPAEVLAIYPAGAALLTAARVPLQWFVAGCVIAIILVRGVATAPAQNPKLIQWPAVVVAIISFLVWVLAIGGWQLWFTKDVAQTKAIASAFALLWTWVAPNFVKAA
jgi:hypothetical protein